MNCPVDGTELRMTTREGVEIDYCPKCRGIWLDRGELDKLIERSLAADLPGRPSTAGTAKAKNDYHDDDRFEDDRRPAPRRDWDDDRRDERYDDRKHPKKRKSFLGDIFDIFD